MKHLGVPHGSLHDIRAQLRPPNWLRVNVPVKTVSAALGHSSAAFTLDTHAHCLDGDQERSGEAIERALRDAIR